MDQTSHPEEALPLIVDPTKYGPSFMAWWSALQPAWRVALPSSESDDGQALFTKNVPADESWATLEKGGSAGLYFVIMALLWWVQAVGPDSSDVGALAVIEDFYWVLCRICEVINSRSEPSTGKRARVDDAESSGSGKRYVIFHYISLS